MQFTSPQVSEDVGAEIIDRPYASSCVRHGRNDRPPALRGRRRILRVEDRDDKKERKRTVPPCLSEFAQKHIHICTDTERIGLADLTLINSTTYSIMLRVHHQVSLPQASTTIRPSSADGHERMHNTASRPSYKLVPLPSSKLKAMTSDIRNPSSFQVQYKEATHAQ